MMNIPGEVGRAFWEYFRQLKDMYTVFRLKSWCEYNIDMNIPGEGGTGMLEILNIFHKNMSLILVETIMPVPASHGIFIISAPLLNSNHHIHVLKLSKIILKDGDYIGDFKFSRGLL